MTRVQYATLRFLRDYIAQNGISPSMQEIAEGIGSSRGAVHKHVHALADQGKIFIEPRRQRSIRVLSLRTLSIDLPCDLSWQLNVLASKRGMTAADVVLECLREHLSSETFTVQETSRASAAVTA